MRVMSPKSSGTQKRRKAQHSILPLLFFSCLFLLFFSSPAAAQGCAMCRTALEGQAQSLTQALNLGILVLLIPPITIMSTILFVTFRQDK